MNKETMTVHKALCELKTMDARISKAINATTFVVPNKHSNTKINGLPINQVADRMKSNFQSVQDLIARRNAIKRAVVKSNATTEVLVGGVQYTVAEAIEMKNHGVEYKRMLLAKMERDYALAQNTANRDNGEDLQRRANEYIESMYGKTDMKGLTEEAAKKREEFITAMTTELIDPLNIKDKIDELNKEITEFMIEVDSALSVSNAITTLEIEY